MAKEYTASYRTYLNDRLKQVEFHGHETHPLYLKVTYRRKSLYFKSYYFELFSDLKYSIFFKKANNSGILNKVIAAEEVLLKYLLKDIDETFSLDSFEEKYKNKSKDLCSLTEKGFRAYLMISFTENNLASLGKAISVGSEKQILFDVIQDMKLSFQKGIITNIVSNSLTSGQPYLLLWEYSLFRGSSTLPYFSIFEWGIQKEVDKFRIFVESKYSKKETEVVFTIINNWIDLYCK